MVIPSIRTKKLMTHGTTAFCGIAHTYRIAPLNKLTIVWVFHSLPIGPQMIFRFMMATANNPPNAKEVSHICETSF